LNHIAQGNKIEPSSGLRDFRFPLKVIELISF